MTPRDPPTEPTVAEPQDGLGRHDGSETTSPYEDLGYGPATGATGGDDADDSYDDREERDAMAMIRDHSERIAALAGPHRVHAIQVQEFLGRLATASVPPVSRPRFCATEMCHGVAELLQSTDGHWRPGSHCGPCARQLGMARTVAKVRRAVTRIPSRARAMTFSSQEIMGLVPEDKIQLAKRVVDDPQVLSVMIVGGSGNGKTVLAAAMANHILSKARVGCSPQDLDRASRIGWTSASLLGTARVESGLGRVPETIRQALYASFLVIDELGREVGEEGSAAVWRVIDGRHSEGKPTVTTTYLSGDALRKKYDAGFIRRFFEGQDRQSVCINLGPKKKKGAA